MKKSSLNKIDIFTFGHSSTTFQSTLILSEDYLLTATGSNLSLWNIQTLERIKFIQSNHCAIKCLKKNSKYIFSISEDGQIVILDYDLNIIKEELPIFQSIILFASLNEKYLVIQQKETQYHKGVTQIFDIRDISNIKKVFEMFGRNNFCTLNQENDLFFCLQYQKIISTDEEKKISQIEPYSNTALLFDLKAKENDLYCPIKSLKLDTIDSITHSISNGKNLISIIYLYRDLVVINMVTLEIVYHGKLDGKGSINSSIWVDNNLYICPFTNYLLEIDFSQKNLPEFIDKNIKQDGIKLWNIKSDGLTDKTNFIHYFKKQHKLISININDSSINSLDLTTQKTKRISFSNITLCGLTCNKDGSLFAYGDFSGTVSIQRNIKENYQKPLYQIQISSPIRSLAWNPIGDSLFIGDFSGKLYQWQFIKNSLEKVYSLDKTLTCLKFHNNDLTDQNYLLASFISGDFMVFKIEQNYKTSIFYKETLGHKPHTDFNSDFGTLTLYAEIWSIAWNPDHIDQFGTCSEDQSIKIWGNVKNELIVQETLEMHQKAVTSIDWQNMCKALGQIFVTCSDDRVVKIYNVVEGKFIKRDEFCTSFKDQKHTLTYLALSKNGQCVAVGSINGYLFVYDILNKKFVYDKRIHLGGIEGLVYQNDKIITCGSDNCLNVIRLDSKEQQNFQLEASL